MSSLKPYKMVDCSTRWIMDN